ncbi:intracellular growth attenuator family protein [Alteraurantiacibacter aquimixticola]|uniref:Uncharacterized protein n=1 Tax=Alteraurantiacibacter aquimixticola TaxID=2489173 RepID=A0A4T3F5Q9_9SPHN|nr:intracellular growth attenuator family protein [Alteraurantiacibacter aquimixticola]TIX51819.1 hypothetical protein E5222_05075 [Alteraurantiacibacter aquimixticola]
MIAKLVISAFLIVPILALVTPRILYPWLVASFAPLLAGLLWLSNRPVSFQQDWAAFGNMILFAGVIACLLAFLFRYIASALAAKFLIKAAPSPIDWRPFKVSLLLTLGLAFLWWCMPLVAGVVGPHVVLLAGAIVAIALVVLARRMAAVHHRIAAFSASAIVSGLLLFSLTQPGIVVREANRAAQGQPYCLLVADGDRGHRPARSLADLTPVIMRAPARGQIALSNHAQIRVDEAPAMHWSYFGRGFVNGADLYRGVDCERQREWASRLGWFGRDQG